jgi:hypothetical protein
MAFPKTRAQSAFDRQRRRHLLRRIAARVRKQPGDVDDMLTFDDVVAALGRHSMRDIGVRTIPLDAIVGTLDRRQGEFDRAFRPTSTGVRDRWKRIAAARARGEYLPPIEVYKVGDLYFVEDGHHRVSVARALGDGVIDARVREVRTTVGAPPDLRPGVLPLKRHEREFFERVPLPPDLRRQIRLTDEWRYAQLAALIEARGYRESHAQGRLVPREELAVTWFHEQYEPVVQVLRETGVGGAGTDTDRYLRFVMLRYLLVHRQEWTDQVIDETLAAVRPPSPEDDTLVHQILKEMHRD